MGSKVTDDINKKVAIVNLIPLDCSNQLDKEKWLHVWKRGLRTANALLVLPFSVFSSRLRDQPEIAKFLNSFFSEFPRFWDHEELEYYFNNDESVRKIAMEMYHKILLILCRASSREENGDKLTEEMYRNTAYCSGIFTVESLLKIISLYWENNGTAVHGILQRIVCSLFDYVRDAATVTNNLSDFLIQVSSTIVDCLRALDKDDNIYNECSSLLSLCNEVLYALPKLLLFMPYFIPLNDAAYSFCSSIPSFVELLEDIVVNPLKSIPSKKQCFMLSLIDYLRNSAFACFDAFIKLQDDNERKISLLHEALSQKKFIFYYNIGNSIDNLLSSMELDKKNKEYILKNFENVYEEQMNLVIKRLEGDGLLSELGKPSDPIVLSQVDSILEILPHFSPEYIHLCLRSFGYDVEAVTNALLNTSLLPLDLQAVMNVELTKCPSATLDDGKEIDQNEVSKEFTENSETQAGGSLIDIKPVLKNNDEKTLKEETHCKPKLLDLLQQLALDADSKKQCTSENSSNNATVMKLMNNTKKYYVPDSDKVALRPTYEKYFYENENEGMWDVYGDEYDDDVGNSQFYREETLEDVEPNRNHEIQLEDSEEEDENDESAKSAVSIEPNVVFKETQRRFGTGRRAREMSSANDIKYNVNAVNDLDAQQSENVNELETESNVGSEIHSQQQRSIRGRGNGRFGNTDRRDRQLKERHKGADKRRMYDKKRRQGMF